MTRFNLQSFLFALVLLILVVMGKSEGAGDRASPVTSRISDTSLTAQVSSFEEALILEEENSLLIVPPPPPAPPPPSTHSTNAQADRGSEEPSGRSSPRDSDSRSSRRGGEQSRTTSSGQAPPPPPALPPPPPLENLSRQNLASLLNPAVLESRVRFFTSLDPEPAKPFRAPPRVLARAALVKDLSRESIYFEKNLSQRWPLASITKLMTALVALENFSKDGEVKISPRAVATEGLSGGFTVGEVFKVADLIKALLIVSSNDAATALADYLGSQKFLELMRSRAFDLGLSQTTFIDPSGLSILSQSTISDLEKLTAYILKNRPIIFEISALPQAQIKELTSMRSRLLINNNKFAGEPNFVGGKTGYTEEASGNLLSILSYKSSLFLIIVFGAEDRVEETQKLYTWLKSNF